MRAMLAISMTFPAHRYHATPWGKHVNEADVEWPPSPWRITRALIATWHRKVHPDLFQQSTFERLLDKLAHVPPEFKLPDVVHTHSRHYVPLREKGLVAIHFDGTGRRVGLVPDPNNKGRLKTDTTLIFDAFVRMDDGAELVIVWPGVDLTTEEAELFDALLDRMGYLGRAESWVEARRLLSWAGEPNCKPGVEEVDVNTGELFERVPVQLPRTAEAYANFRQEAMARLKQRKEIKPKQRKDIEATLPERIVDALAVETGDLRSTGWSAPPAAVSVDYLRPAGSLRTTGRLRSGPTNDRKHSTFRFALYGRPLPLLIDTVRVAEWIRRAVMGRIKRVLGEDMIPALISGHGLDDKNRHGHAFWLPEDADGDGRIDHFIVHVPDGVGPRVAEAIRGLQRLWNVDGGEWRVAWEGDATVGGALEKIPTPLLAPSTVFETVTPYLMPWYAKTNFGVAEQIARECRERGIVEPVVEGLPSRIHLAKGRRLRPVDFHRFRSKRGLAQPDTHGQFVRLRFPEPVKGPLALGFACHFGLGLFVPVP